MYEWRPLYLKPGLSRASRANSYCKNHRSYLKELKNVSTGHGCPASKCSQTGIEDLGRRGRERKRVCEQSGGEYEGGEERDISLSSHIAGVAERVRATLEKHPRDGGEMGSRMSCSETETWEESVLGVMSIVA